MVSTEDSDVFPGFICFLCLFFLESSVVVFILGSLSCGWGFFFLFFFLRLSADFWVNTHKTTGHCLTGCSPSPTPARWDATLSSSLGVVGANTDHFHHRRHTGRRSIAASCSLMIDADEPQLPQEAFRSSSVQLLETTL